MENAEIVEIPEDQRKMLFDDIMRLLAEEAPIDCKRLFKFRCPKVWQALEPTDEETVRFCPSCRRKVFLCTSRDDANKHSGECIALLDKALARMVEPHGAG